MFALAPSVIADETAMTAPSRREPHIVQPHPICTQTNIANQTGEHCSPLQKIHPRPICNKTNPKNPHRKENL